MRYIILIFLLTFSSSLLAQRGKDGATFVTTANQRINEYTSLASNANAGVVSINVTDNSLNGNGRFANSLAGGDLIMIIQMQGALISGTLTGTIASPLDSTWGEIINYNNCGLYEFVQVKGVTGTSIINLDCPLKNSYTMAGKVQVVRVPRMASLTINNADVTADAWNGSVGGVVAIEVKGNTVINSLGKIDVTGKGFRGGVLDNNTTYGVNNVGSTLDSLGAEKGEGIAGFQNDYTIYGGKYCKGAAANGGGGGDAHNAGGGGGANGGNPLIWSGHGMPNLSTPNWALAWELEFMGFSTLVSSGGGQGGYSFSGNNLNALAVGPDDASWGGDGRNNQGGMGGRPLDYSTGRLFLGGGGGAGDQNNTDGGKGGNGGGLIYLMSYGTVSGAGQLISNGSKGDDACCSSTFGTTGNDGAGGGGAGGTIIINSVGNVSGLVLKANGGNGGVQDVKASVGTTNEAEGPGGGGGGGYVAVSNVLAGQTATGGNNGTTDSDGLTEFIPNGATKGGVGTVNQSITNFHINVAGKDTVCKGILDTISAALLGTVPLGTSLVWYNARFGGNQLGTGPDLPIGPLYVSTTFYVGTCPGTYRDSMLVFVEPDVFITGTPSICKGNSSGLLGHGALTYTWSPAATLNTTNGTNVIATPTSFSTYTVVGVDVNGCADTSTYSVTVNIPPVLTISNDTIICRGDSALINVSGANSFLWTPATGLSSTNTSNAYAKPNASTSYLIIGTDINGCIDTADVSINLDIPPVDAGLNDSICPGETASLLASGNTNYLWSTNATTPAINVTPAISTTYTVSTFNGQCGNYDSVLVFVGSYPAANAGLDVTIIQGSSIGLNATGGAAYQWSPPTALTCTNCASPIASPTITTVYTVTVTNPGGCTDVDSMIVIVDTLVTNINCDELFIPNFFSPNTDNSNDVFYVRGGCIKDFHLEIYDRWGKKVFETTDVTIGWDGKYKGELLTNAVFVYQVKLEFDNGDKKSLSGNITLLR